MKSSFVRDYPPLLLVVRLIVGAVFIGAGLTKIASPEAFYNAILNFHVLYGTNAVVAVYALPSFELVIGAAIFAGRLPVGAAVAATVLLCVFSSALGVAWSKGLNVSCGCFGQTGLTQYPVALTRNLALVIGLLALLRFELGRLK